MARITGKNGKILAETSRTTVAGPTTLTDAGAHIVYTFPALTIYIDPTKPPTILVNGAAPAVAYTIDYILGSVTFASALAPGDVVTALAYVYSAVVEIGDLFNWAVDTKVDIVDSTGFQDTWHQKLATFLGWTGSAEGYYVSSYWYTQFTNKNAMYVVLYPDKNSVYRWVGACFIDWGIKVTKDAPVTSPIKFEGTHELRLITV